MFGIDDPLIILPYLLSVVCVIFAAWFGLNYKRVVYSKHLRIRF